MIAMCSVTDKPRKSAPPQIILKHCANSRRKIVSSAARSASGKEGMFDEIFFGTMTLRP